MTAHQAGRFFIQAEGTSTHAVGYLEIVAYSLNYVIFIHPQSGEEWEGGTNQNITWELIGSIDSGTLYYSTTGGSEWTEIDEIPDLAVQQYSWLVPDTNETLNDCMFKMVWDGGESTSSVFSIVPSTSVEEDNDTSYPGTFRLERNYPNPFINSTEIEYGLPKDAYVNIAIYNLSCQKVVTLVNESKNGGYYTIRWNGRDNSGKRVPPGVYFLKFDAGQHSATRKLLLMR